MALRLHEATHVGQAREERSPLEHDGGDDGVEGPLAAHLVRVRVRVGVRVRVRDEGVEGPLAAHQRVRVLRLECEVGASVLQAEAAALGHDGGAEAAEVGVDLARVKGER